MGNMCGAAVMEGLISLAQSEPNPNFVDSFMNEIRIAD